MKEEAEELDIGASEGDEGIEWGKVMRRNLSKLRPLSSLLTFIGSFSS